jgi:hypothetical protein
MLHQCAGSGGCGIALKGSSQSLCQRRTRAVNSPVQLKLLTDFSVARAAAPLPSRSDIACTRLVLAKLYAASLSKLSAIQGRAISGADRKMAARIIAYNYVEMPKS